MNAEEYYDLNHTASQSELIEGVEFVYIYECIRLMENYHQAKLEGLTDTKKWGCLSYNEAVESINKLKQDK